MQRLLERNNNRPRSSSVSFSHLATCVTVGIALIYFCVVALPYLNGSSIAGEVPLQTTRSSVTSVKRAIEDEATVSSQPSLPAWGYTKNRNIPRWRAIYAEIARDEATHHGSFSLMDYGSDQGYFSISVGNFFPHAIVMGLELGGVGGEIWKKSGDVLKVQEAKLDELHVSNVRICQAKMHPDHFRELHKSDFMTDYQLVLSVFHWFDLSTRKEFEEVLTVLLLNSKTTFLELPIIGDNGPTIQKQVGYKNFVNWYDGRSDIGVVIEEAAASRNVVVKVRKIATVPWIKWQRETFRVDVVRSGVAADSNSRDEMVQKFGCVSRRKIFQCAQREKFSDCEFVDGG